MGNKKTTSLLFLERAFTLIEILVVLSIITIAFSYTATKVFRRSAKIKDTFHDLSRLNRRLYTSAKMHKKNYRLAFDLKKRETTFWVEKENQKKEYKIADSILKKPLPIHPLLSLTSIESSHWEEEKTNGLVFIYYPPKGIGQEAALHFKRRDRKGDWTLYFPPLKREVEVINKEISLNEITGN